MRCPFCRSEESQVIESRGVTEEDSIRRRRECANCKKRFTTYERTKNKFFWVVKKDGTREPFDREKVRRGVVRAIEKRPVTPEAAEKLIDEVEGKMLSAEKEDVQSRLIGKEVLRRLKKIDKVAWLRFASVYLEFEDLEDFKKAIKQ